MKEKQIDPKVFVAVIVVLVAVIGFFMYRAAQPPPAAKPPTAVSNPLAKPDSPEHMQGMMESMQKSRRRP